MDVAFAEFLRSHEELTARYDQLKTQRNEREKLKLNTKTLAKTPLSEDVERFRAIAEQLSEMGICAESAKVYFDALVTLGLEVAYGARDAEIVDTKLEGAPNHWSTTDLYRANLAGMAAQMESHFALGLAVTAHPQFQLAVSSLSDFAVHMTKYFMG